MASKILVRDSDSGGHRQIFQCASGCAHLTFDAVTLNFPNLSALRTLASRFRAEVAPNLHATENAVVEIQYRNVTLNLSTDEALAFGRLLEELEFLLLGVPNPPARKPKEAHS